MAFHYSQTERTKNLPVYPIYSCPVCKYPIEAPTYDGQQLHCPYCGSSIQAIAQEGITIPTSVLVGFIAFGLGVVLGPPLIATTEQGSQWLARKARERLT